MNAFALRCATIDDFDLTYAITKDAMRSHVEATWGVGSEREQLHKHRRHFNPDVQRLILVQERTAGLLHSEQEPACVWLVKL